MPKDIQAFQKRHYDGLLLHSIVRNRLIGIRINVNVYLESCIPEIPSQGTVGASGDLAPLAHLAAGILIVRKKDHVFDGLYKV